MSVELKVPSLGESITEATVSKWLKKVGDSFEVDEPLVEIETDKISLEVPAPSSGVLSEIKIKEGKDVDVGGVLAIIEDSTNSQKIKNDKIKDNDQKTIISENKKEKISYQESTNLLNDPIKLSPSVNKLVEENKLDKNKIKSSRNDGRITKGDVLEHMHDSQSNQNNESEEEIVPMSKIRKTIAKRLKDAQNTAAILTTFNEVDMSGIIKVRQAKKEDFINRYGVKLGFMSFFVKASVMALMEYPAVNAEIRHENIIYKNHFDIGIAIGTEKGLVVPVLKNADKLNFGEIEKQIVDLSSRAKTGSLTIDDLSGGTFTISNGGVYGSMLSTPIINSPQSAILGMHNIKKRAVVEDDTIVIRPIMYLAFSYDHRIIDGKESVSFLIKMKDLLENPSSLILST